MKQFSIGWTLIQIYTFLVYAFLFAPIVVVMVLAFNPKQFGIFPMEGFSFRWFIKLAHNEAIIAAFKNSLVLGSLSSVPEARRRYARWVRITTVYYRLRQDQRTL